MNLKNTALSIISDDIGIYDGYFNIAEFYIKNKFWQDTGYLNDAVNYPYENPNDTNLIAHIVFYCDMPEQFDKMNKAIITYEMIHDALIDLPNMCKYVYSNMPILWNFIKMACDRNTLDEALALITCKDENVIEMITSLPFSDNIFDYIKIWYHFGCEIDISHLIGSKPVLFTAHILSFVSTACINKLCDIMVLLHLIEHNRIEIVVTLIERYTITGKCDLYYIKDMRKIVEAFYGVISKIGITNFIKLLDSTLKSIIVAQIYDKFIEFVSDVPMTLRMYLYIKNGAVYFDRGKQSICDDIMRRLI